MDGKPSGPEFLNGRAQHDVVDVDVGRLALAHAAIIAREGDEGQALGRICQLRKYVKSMAEM